MNLKVFIYTILFVVLLIACNSDEKRRKNKVEEVKKEKPKFDEPLTKKNAVELLKKYGDENTETRVLIKTSMGDIKIKLYENTPIHRANFIRLVKNNFYKNTVFYRVIKDFMIQGGGSDDLAFRKKMRKMGTYRIPSEFVKANIHKKGALSMARRYENNPNKESVAFDFFLVQGKKYTKQEMDALAAENKITFNKHQMKVYTNEGGAPHLDGEHTVFGEIIEGLNVVQKIASVETDKGDWPLEDISVLNIEIEK